MKRIVTVILFLLGLFSILIVQFYKIQIVEGDKWTQEANRQHYFIVNEPFLRGTFFSNTSVKQDNPETPQKLVVDLEKFHLFIDPESIPEKVKTSIAKKLITLLQIPQDEEKQFISNFFRKSRSRKLKMWLSKEQRNFVLEWWLPYAYKRRIPRNALFFVTDYQRSYPFGKLLGQVLHTIQNNKDETTHESIPTGGLELYFNKYLSGKQGKRRLMRSPRNSLETGEVVCPPQHGADIYLTINHCLQAIAEEELEKGVIKCKAKRGWAVMMNPFTGEILALAHYPFFFPAEYKTYFNDPKLIEITSLPSISEAHEPGSVVKPLTIALALKANKEVKAKGQKLIFDPEEKMSTSDSRFPGRKNLQDTHFHSYLNMNMAVQKSSNIYVARLIDKVIEKLGKEWYKKALHEIFGFGEKTHLEVPLENPGMVPTPGKKHPNGTLEWSLPTPFSLAMGHNIQITAIQLARAYAIFANGGYLVQPTLVDKIVHNDEILRFKREKKKVLDEDIVKKVVYAMRFTTKLGGTARKADILGYTEAGKTGTAQKIIDGSYSQKKYCASFAGFAPVNNPAFVLVVTMDEPEYGYIPGWGKNHMGGVCSAAVFKEIGERSLEYLGIPPDDPHGYPVGDPRYDPAKAVWVQETRQLQEIYEKWNNVAK